MYMVKCDVMLPRWSRARERGIQGKRISVPGRDVDAIL